MSKNHQADGYVVLIPLLSFHREIKKFKVHVFLKNLFHKTQFMLVYFSNKGSKA